MLAIARLLHLADLAAPAIADARPCDSVIVDLVAPRDILGPDIARDDQLAQLQKLGELYQSGVLSAEEFAAMKAKILQ